ncbi:hypothetical protein EJ06DRAFT_480103 [Trichodelitschia bisporula]|uniref:Impact N-terminal domain-containing protein n=1 Tax=Trichodelitschia bisporula TaxID=703511 RepID=A0A6G1HQN1_9PEZI|nr:hypothetical protein EJ06DRAFT_480103 [Trichodelitschia bisporula]
MSSPAEIQALLRFLSQDAKMPLATAMSRVKDLKKAELNTPAQIAASDIEQLKLIFGEEPIAKQVLNAAKRITKRGSAPGSAKCRSSKRNTIKPENVTSPAALEESLALPNPITDEVEIMQTTVFTNRAPLVLAFTVALLKHTMPEQPLSSRLSLAQAVVSLNSRSKAVSLGLESGKSADEEGWGAGRPTIKIMGREIRTMRRWGYDPREHVPEQSEDVSAAASTKDIAPLSNLPALWALDLEALKKSSTSETLKADPGFDRNMPIYTPQSARAYLLKSFDAPPNASPTTKKRVTFKTQLAVKEHNLGLLLGALDLLFQSWAPSVDKPELDLMAWNWYVKVRPEVDSGVAGWGSKGNVKLSDILQLRKQV